MYTRFLETFIFASSSLSHLCLAYPDHRITQPCRAIHVQTFPSQPHPVAGTLASFLFSFSSFPSPPSFSFFPFFFSPWIFLGLPYSLSFGCKRPLGCTHRKWSGFFSFLARFPPPYHKRKCTGKTMVAEIAMLRLFMLNPDKKVGDNI